MKLLILFLDRFTICVSYIIHLFIRKKRPRICKYAIFPCFSLLRKELESVLDQVAELEFHRSGEIIEARLYLHTYPSA